MTGLSVDWETRCRQLCARDAERAAELKVVWARISELEKQVARETARADAADRNAAQWHALLLREKIVNRPNRGQQA